MFFGAQQTINNMVIGLGRIGNYLIWGDKGLYFNTIIRLSSRSERHQEPRRFPIFHRMNLQMESSCPTQDVNINIPTVPMAFQNLEFQGTLHSIINLNVVTGQDEDIHYLNPRSPRSCRGPRRFLSPTHRWKRIILISYLPQYNFIRLQGNGIQASDWQYMRKVGNPPGGGSQYDPMCVPPPPRYELLFHFCLYFGEKQLLTRFLQTGTQQTSSQITSAATGQEPNPPQGSSPSP